VALVDDVVLVVALVLAPPLPDPLVAALVLFAPAPPPGMLSSPPHAWAAAKGNAKMTSVQMNLRMLRLLPLGVF
jgi:hypothetical protein